MVPDIHIMSESRSTMICWVIGRPVLQSVGTDKSGTVYCKSPNPSVLGGLSAGHPAGPSVDLYNARILIFDNSILSKLLIQYSIITL